MKAAENQLATILTRNWWVLLLGGLVAIAFGVLAGLQPAISLAALVLLFGAYTMADGVLAPRPMYPAILLGCESCKYGI
jgi:uncharacterized membrane protein HdeD (DUF308 family)